MEEREGRSPPPPYSSLDFLRLLAPSHSHTPACPPFPLGAGGGILVVSSMGTSQIFYGRSAPLDLSPTSTPSLHLSTSHAPPAS
jgi:hypothetical protein